MAKLFDKDGNEVEAFTPEELKAKQKEAVDEYIKENPVKQEDYNKLKTDLETATTKLKEFEEGGGNDDAQKKRLKDAKEAAEKALADGLTGIRKEMDDFKNNFITGHKTKVLDKLSKGDPELKKKIELEYDQYSEGKKAPANEIEVTERLTKAFTLATGNKPAPNFMDGAAGAGTRGDGKNGGSGDTKEPESENAKAQRKALGITDADVEKFGPDSAAAKAAAGQQ